MGTNSYNLAENLRFKIHIHSLAFLLICLFNEVSISQTAHFVMNGNDGGAGSLRQAILDAGEGDTIRFMPDVDSVFLTTSELFIDKSIVISGNPGNAIIKRVETGLKFRIFHIKSLDSVTVEFNNLLISGGNAPDGYGSILDGQHGGGVYNPDLNNHLILMDCRIESNCTGEGIDIDAEETGDGGYGGGIYSSGSLSLVRCQITANYTGNSADGSSGFDWSSMDCGNGGKGGGIYCSNDLILENCTFQANHTGNGGNASGVTYSAGCSGGEGGDGGGLCCEGCLVTITNSSFNENSAGNGGYAHDIQNTCDGGNGGNGGAIFLSGCQVVIENTNLNGNYTGYGNYGSGNERGFGGDGGSGGGIYALNSHLSIDSTDIMMNFTGYGGKSGTYGYPERPGDGGDGGGIYLKESFFNIENCLLNENFTGNGANASFVADKGGNGGDGGGICIINAPENSFMRNCNIDDNRTGNGGTILEKDYFNYYIYLSGGNGGGMAVYESDAIIHVINCLVSSNFCGDAVYKTSIPPNGEYGLPKGGSGGGIYLKNSNSVIVNNTIANNSTGTAQILPGPGREFNLVADSTRGKGGGVCSTDQPVTVFNSIIAKNFLENYSSDNDIEGYATLNYTLLYNDSLVNYTGTGNLVNSDPHFISFPDDLSLSANSPAINHGSPDTTGLFLPELDLAGNPRLFGILIDMGTYEYQNEPIGIIDEKKILTSSFTRIRLAMIQGLLSPLKIIVILSWMYSIPKEPAWIIGYSITRRQDIKLLYGKEKTSLPGFIFTG